MKKTSAIIMLAAIAAVLPACKQAQESAEAMKPALVKLEKAVTDGKYMYVMQDALCYGQGWHIEAGALASDPVDKCDIKSVCGDYPAIVGFDLGGIEKADTCNLDGVDYAFMRRAAIEHARRGGLVTFSWHLRNPLTGGDAWDVSSDKVVASVLPEGECHEMFMQWLCRLADFLDTMRDDDGTLIPIIFRPWHENTGSWFWWGARLCTVDQYRQLWQMTYDYLVKERGLDSMAWAYSPSSTALKECGLERYPGDEIIDIIGVDRYAAGKQTEISENFISGMHGDLEYLGEFAKEHEILLAVTETGQESQTCPGWWTKELMPALEGLPVCYVLTWRNAWDAEHPGHWFSAFPGAPNEADFVEFYKSDKTLFLNDIR